MTVENFYNFIVRQTYELDPKNLRNNRRNREINR